MINDQEGVGSSTDLPQSISDLLGEVRKGRTHAIDLVGHGPLVIPLGFCRVYVLPFGSHGPDKPLV